MDKPNYRKLAAECGMTWSHSDELWLASTSDLEAFATGLYKLAPTMLNGLAESETSASASVAGLALDISAAAQLAREYERELDVRAPTEGQHAAAMLSALRICGLSTPSGEVAKLRAQLETAMQLGRAIEVQRDEVRQQLADEKRNAELAFADAKDLAHKYNDAQRTNDLLRDVYECARKFLRYNGIDKAKVDAAVDALDVAIEEVKTADAGYGDELPTRAELQAQLVAVPLIELLDIFGGIMKSKEGWKWYGFPGHHCCGSRCQYHLCTNIGNTILVSTVGRFVPDPLRHPEKTDMVGSGRDFETMVFKIDGEDENGDPRIVDYGDTLDRDAFNSSIEAERGHYSMCDKWAEMSNAELCGERSESERT